MVKIRYRHYQDGDDDACAKVYVRAFQMNLYSRLMDGSSWHWRYPSDPDFKPEMIQIAEDTDKNRIVGMVCAHLVEKMLINNTEYLIGCINDVSTDPRYVRGGIAKTLMNMAIDYMDSRDCDYSMLAADPSGFPRSKIYLKAGYVDIDSSYLNVSSPYFFQFIKEMPATLGLIPVFIAINYLPRFLSRIRTKFNDFFKDFSHEIAINSKHWEMMEAINQIFPKYYDGFKPYNKERYKWMRIDVSNKKRTPVNVFTRKGGEIVGGATLTDILYGNLVSKIKVTASIANHIFLDKSIFLNKRDQHLGYLYLFDKIFKAAVSRRQGLFLHLFSKRDYDLKRSYRSLGLFQLPIGTIMMRSMKKTSQYLNLKNHF